jgi:hypothetical protein
MKKMRDANPNQVPDLVGQRFGRGIVEARDGNRWRLKCHEGNLYFVPTGKLRRGHTRSCGCLAADLTAQRNRRDWTGHKQGKLTVLEGTEEKLLVQCECSKGEFRQKRISRASYKQGTKSCGCLRKEARLKVQPKPFQKERSVGGRPEENAPIKEFLKDKLHLGTKALLPICKKRFPEERLTKTRLRTIIYRMRSKPGK